MTRTFSASEVAFEGFRLTRERPRSILLWSGLTFAFSVLSAVLIVGLAGDAMSALAASSQDPSQDPAEAFASLSRLAPMYAILTPASIVFYAVLYAAVYRAILRPSEAPGSGDVRLGGDELRQGLVLFAVGLLFFAGYLVVGIVAAVLIGVIAAVVGGAVSIALSVLIGLAAFAGLCWLLVRLSLVAPYTFDRRSLDLPAAWRLTRGAGWKLFAAYLLAFALMVVVLLLGLLIYSLLAMAVGGGADALATVFQPDFSSLGAYFTPPMLIYLVVASVLGALAFAILVGATGAAYRALAPSPQADVFA